MLCISFPFHLSWYFRHFPRSSYIHVVLTDSSQCQRRWQSPLTVPSPAKHKNATCTVLPKFWASKIPGLSTEILSIESPQSNRRCVHFVWPLATGVGIHHRCSKAFIRIFINRSSSIDYTVVKARMVTAITGCGRTPFIEYKYLDDTYRLRDWAIIA